MPTSKQARTAQSRQMDRLAAQRLVDEQQRKKRRIITTIAAVVAAAALIGILIVTGAFDSKGEGSATPPTTAAPISAKDKPCVALADPLPAGAPVMNIKTGPPPTELVMEDIEVGTGAEVQPGATVTAKYVGVSCSTGKIFDENYSEGKEPATFPLSNVVKGWTDGIPGMKIGGKRLLGIPSEQGYGPSGQPPTIAADETLWFVVEITDTK